MRVITVFQKRSLHNLLIIFGKDLSQPTKRDRYIMDLVNWYECIAHFFNLFNYDSQKPIGQTYYH